MSRLRRKPRVTQSRTSKKITESILDAVKENAESIQRRVEERNRQAARSLSLIEKFGDTISLREEKKTETYGNNPRTRDVLHYSKTVINPTGVISSCEIFEAHGETGKYGLRLNFVAMDEATLKQVLFLLAGSKEEVA